MLNIIFLFLGICRQCRGKLDRELSQEALTAKETAAPTKVVTEPTAFNENTPEKTQYTDTEGTATVRPSCYLLLIYLMLF